MRHREHPRRQQMKQVMMVICEGESEKVYIEILRNHFRFPLKIIVRVGGNEISQREIDGYIRDIRISNNDVCQIVFVYDADVREVTAKLQSFEGLIILSNPCIELWYILHHQDCYRELDSRQTLELLKRSNPLWQNYRKGHLTSLQEEHLISNLSLACKRAEKMKSGLNPSTNMPIFIRLLQNGIGS